MIRIVSPEAFVQAFDEVVSSMEKQLLKEWFDQTKYTKTFLAPLGVLPQIASHLELDYHREVGRVDAILYRPIEGEKAVLVAVEHEHLANGTRREAWTLSQQNVPLKVLITYPEDTDHERLLLDSYISVLKATDLFNDFRNVKRQLVIFGFANDSIEWHYHIYAKRGFVRIDVTK